MKEEIIANLKEYHSNQGIAFTSEEDSINYYRGLVEIIEHLVKSSEGVIGRQAILDIQKEARERIVEIIKNIKTEPHDETSDGIICKCWCIPKQTMVNGSWIFIHNDLIDREKLKEKIKELDNLTNE